MKQWTNLRPIEAWTGVDVNLEISLGEYGFAIAKMDDDMYAIIRSIEADENCNYTKFIIDTFYYSVWLAECMDEKSWIQFEKSVLPCVDGGTMEEYIKNVTPCRLFYDLMGYYGFNDFYSHCYGYVEYTLEQCMQRIEEDNQYVETLMAA